MNRKHYQTVDDCGLLPAVAAAIKAGWRLAGRTGTAVTMTDGANMVQLRPVGHRIRVTTLGQSDAHSLVKPLRLGPVPGEN